MYADEDLDDDAVHELIVMTDLRDGGVVGEPGGVAAGAGALVGARGAALVRDLRGHLYHDT